MPHACSPDWRCPSDYRYILQLDRLSLAWEYLRRNPDYRRAWADRRFTDLGITWGLRFSG